MSLQSVPARWQLPLREDWPITARWGYALDYPVNGGFHYGLDWGCPQGTAVYAVADGQVVIAAENQPQGYPGVQDGAWGWYVELDHGDGLRSGYAHLRSLVVYPSQEVQQGQLLGFSGASGLVTGPHLHFQTFRNGKRIDPMARFA